MTTGRSVRWRGRSDARANEGDGENESSESDHAAFWLTYVTNGSSGFTTIHDSGTSFEEAAVAARRRNAVAIRPHDNCEGRHSLDYLISSPGSTLHRRESRRFQVCG